MCGLVKWYNLDAWVTKRVKSEMHYGKLYEKG